LLHHPGSPPAPLSQNAEEGLVVADAEMEYDCRRHTPNPGVAMETPRNPYAAPSSRVEDAVTVRPNLVLIPNGRAVPAGQGWHWIAAAWDLFKRSPGTWILIFLLAFAILVATSIVPFVGSIAFSILTPVLTGGVMLGCAALERGEPLEVAHLFAGFREHTAPLVTTGLIYLAGGVLIILVMGLIFGIPLVVAMLGGGAPPPFGLQTLLLLILVAFGLSVPLVMAIWFAPALVALHDMKPVAALQASFIGCLKNIVPFLVYGLIALGLAIVAMLPAFLGLLVLVPVLMASVYTGYRDIFTQATP
jgi:hypothetical protein